MPEQTIINGEQGVNLITTPEGEKYKQSEKFKRDAAWYQETGELPHD